MKKQWILTAALTVVLVAAIATAVILDGAIRGSDPDDSLSEKKPSDSQGVTDNTDGTQNSTQESEDDDSEATGGDEETDQDDSSGTEDSGDSDTPSNGNGTGEDGSGEDEDTPVSGDTEDTPVPDEDDSILQGVTYQMYQSMTGEERQAFCDSFASIGDFMDWLDAAKAAGTDGKEQNTIDGDSGINLGDLLAKK